MQIFSAQAGGRRSSGWSKRWLLLLVVAGAALAIALVARSSAQESEPQKSETVVVVHDGRSLLRIPAQRWLRAGPKGRQTGVALVPRRLRRRVNQGVVELRVNRRRLVPRITAAARRGGGQVRLPVRAISSRIRLPIVKQAYRNNCETAALQMLLAGKGKRADQRRLQRQLPRSRPLDPSGNGTPSMVWGDPDRGFVGRPDGGGVAGGYGVYPGPISALAARSAVKARRFRGTTSRQIYKQLLSGRAVMVWVGLSDGPFQTWRTSQGQRLTGNFGEHTVVLTALRGDRLGVNDPLDGKRKTWTRSQFELMFKRLGRRAVVLS